MVAELAGEDGVSSAPGDRAEVLCMRTPTVALRVVHVGHLVHDGLGAGARDVLPLQLPCLSVVARRGSIADPVRLWSAAGFAQGPTRQLKPARGADFAQ